MWLLRPQEEPYYQG